MKDVLVGRQQVGDAARHLLLAGGQLVHALPYRGDTGRHRLELQQFGRKGGGRGLRDHVRSGLRERCGLRCQPAKLRVQVRDHLSGRVTVRLPSQGGSDADAKRDQEAGEGARGSLAEHGRASRSTGRNGSTGHRSSGTSACIEGLSVDAIGTSLSPGGLRKQAIIL